MRLLRPFLLICALLLIFLSAALTAARAGSDGAYWLLATDTANNGHGLFYQAPGERELHSMRGFDNRTVFERWSPDKKWLYFLRGYPTYNATQAVSSLYRIRLGSLRRECLGTMLYSYGTNPLSDFTLSPDFERVAYASPNDTPNGLHITRGDCQNPDVVFRTDDEIIDSLFWSPDGEWVYFHTQAEATTASWLYRVHPDGSGLEMLTFTSVNVRGTTQSWEWSPDGEWVLMTACPGERCILYTVSADGSDSVLVGRTTHGTSGAWSSDGQWVIFQATSGEIIGDDIFRVRPDGSSKENLTERYGYVFLYGLIDDWILYGVREAGSSTLFRMRLDGSDEQVLFDDALLPSEMIAPLVISDDWIYIFGSNIQPQEAPSRTLYRLRPDGSDAQPLVTGNFYRNLWYVSPDGQHLLTTFDDGLASNLFRMKLDGSQQEHIPLEKYYEPFFSPLFNLPWHAGIVFLGGAGMLALGIISSLTKNPTNS